jgi:hypothetical protein
VGLVVENCEDITKEKGFTAIKRTPCISLDVDEEAT